MLLQAGSRLGPYEIVSRIGAGGMGEVWRARDTRLDRSVAIKVLPPEVARDAQLKVRFEREARAISQLNHPNICTLYDVGDDYLVMELLDGETLSDRVARGPLPIADVLRIGAQIADALDRAHRSGIVHRDLKPGNVMLTKSGAKLLDFGLAKGDATVVQTRGESVLQTAQRPLTQEGTIVGTFQYMAPEQLEGEAVDQRTDIFALGAVLYEMASGRRAFDGKTKTSLIASIVGSDPKPLSQIQPLSPAGLDHVIAKCLAKEPDERWQSAHDISEELKWIASEQTAEMRRKPRRPVWLASVVVAAIVLAAATAFVVARTPRDPHLVVALAAPRQVQFFGHLALSPDGSRAAFVGFGEKQMLWVRSIESGDAHALPGTEGAFLPFWSPDGKNIGFFAGGKMKRVPAAGGPPQVICDAGAPEGATWNGAGDIVFDGDEFAGLTRVSAAGGTPQPLTKLGPRDEAHRWPFFLPDGDHFLYLVDAGRTEDHHLKIGSLRGGEPKELLASAVTNAIYTEPGYLLYVRGGSLLAQPFDAKRLAFTGDAQVVAEEVAANFTNHHYEFSASAGRLTYRTFSPNARLAWVDRNGKVLETISDARRIGIFHQSPNGRAVVFEQLDADGRGDDLWMLDLARHVTTRLTVDPAADVSPAWSPDGTKIAFGGMRSGLGDPFVQDVGSPSSARLLFKSPLGAYPTSWSPNGEFLLFDYDQHASNDVWVYSMRTGEVKPYLAASSRESGAMFSPDGSQVAYVSDESGHAEVYVERFPTHAGRRQISTTHGDTPQWRRDGKELYYAAPGGQIYGVDMTSDSATPQPLFRVQGFFEPSPDGQRFLIAQPVEDLEKMPMTLVTRWNR